MPLRTQKLKELTRFDYLVLIVGLLSAIPIRIVGTFMAAEFFMCALLPFLAPTSFIKSKQVCIAFVLCLLWLSGGIFSDLLNWTAIQNSLKGAISILLLAINIIFAYCILKDNHRRFILFLIGYGISSFLAFNFFKSAALSEVQSKTDLEIWKFYYYLPITNAFLITFFYLGYKKTTIVLCQFFAFYALFQSSRNVFLTYSLASVIMLFQLLIIGKNNLRGIKVYLKSAWMLIITLIMGLFCIKLTYEHMASSGILGEAAKAKYYMQTAGQDGFSFKSGRGDFYITLEKLSENPIIGYGSYAYDKTPGHSMILGAWAYQGILGLPFWLYISYILIIYLYRYSIYDTPFSCAGIIVSTSQLWSILASPFQGRMYLAFLVVSIIVMIKTYNRNRKPSFK